MSDYLSKKTQNDPHTTVNASSKIENSLKARHRKETVFKSVGIFSILLSLSFLVILFIAIISKGLGAFVTHQIGLEINLSAENLEISKDAVINEETLNNLNYRKAIKSALLEKFPSVQTLVEKNSLYHLVSKIASTELRKEVKKNPDLIGGKHLFYLTVSSNTDMYLKGKISENTANETRNLKDSQIAIIKTLQSENKIRKTFNLNFFKEADSREPEIAGMAASIIGSIFTILIFLLCAFPIGVASAFYLEEFAPKNLATDIIEISINNLAAIPSIIYGLLGLVVYLNFFNFPRSSPLVAGFTLALLVLPIIIIATRSAIRTIPPSIKNAAIALGASPIEVMMHHTFPLALPGIMTGTILAISRAIGETAPLLMIGMVAFIADIPSNFTDPTTVMPVQIYLWSDSPETGFAEKTAGAIMVLLGFLILFNSIAVYLRKKFETRW